MVHPVLLRRLGAVVALLGISCLLVALVLPFAHVEPNRALPGMEGALPEDYSILSLLVRTDVPGAHPAAATRILYLLPLLGSCGIAVEGLRAGQGAAATRIGIALLLLGMGSALLGLAAIPQVVHIAGIGEAAPPMLARAGPGARLAPLGFGAIVAGGVLLVVGALLHHWTLRRNERRASATTTG